MSLIRVPLAWVNAVGAPPNYAGWCGVSFEGARALADAKALGAAVTVRSPLGVARGPRVTITDLDTLNDCPRVDPRLATMTAGDTLEFCPEEM